MADWINMSKRMAHKISILIEHHGFTKVLRTNVST